MTTIKVTDTNEVRTLSLVSNGYDYLADVLGPMTYEGSGIMVGEDTDFEMSEEAFDWWADWSAREERINEALDNASKETLEEHVRLIDDYCTDMEELQRQECELLGIEF